MADEIGDTDGSGRTCYLAAAAAAAVAAAAAAAAEALRRMRKVKFYTQNSDRSNASNPITSLPGHVSSGGPKPRQPARTRMRTRVPSIQIDFGRRRDRVHSCCLHFASTDAAVRWKLYAQCVHDPMLKWRAQRRYHKFTG